MSTPRPAPAAPIEAPGGPAPAEAGAFFLVTHFLGASVFWASGFVLIKFAPGLSPFALSALRAIVAVVALGLWFAVQGARFRPRRDQIGHWLVIGTINGWLPNVLTVYALATITSAQGAMIQASNPLIVAVTAPLMFADERLGARRIVGVLVGFAGMALLIGPAAFGVGGATLGGLAAMIAVAFCYAGGALYIRSIRAAEPSELAFGQQLVSGIAALALTLGFEGGSAFAPAPDVLLAVLALGVLGTAVPNVFYMRLIRAAGPMRSSMVSYLIPLWAAIMGFALLGERVGLREVLAGFVIFAGIWLVSAPRLSRA